jgi:hypothetical protein
VSPRVLTEAAGEILVVTINRPEARNAVDHAVAVGIADAMERLDADAGAARRHPHRRGRLLLRGHGSQGIRRRRAALRGRAAGSPASCSARRASR